MTDITRITTVSVLPTPAPVPVTLPEPVTLDAIRKIVREEVRANAALEAAARQALEALERNTSQDMSVVQGNALAGHALRAALAEPVEPVKHKHQWFSTGGMEPGQMRCIHCGVWGRSPATLFDPRGSLGEPIV